MQNFLKTFAEIFDINVMVLFLIAAAFLLYPDAASFKKQGLQKEYKLAKIMGYVYIVLGIGLYTIARFIKV